MNWQERCVRILSSGTEDLFVLAEIAGYEAREFYKSARFAGCRITTSEIAALDLTWENLKGAEIVEDDVDEEKEKVAEALLEDLSKSGSFASTHAIIAGLLPLHPFSGRVIDQYLEVVHENNQVGWISGDSDLVDLHRKMLASPSAMQLDTRMLALKSLLP